MIQLNEGTTRRNSPAFLARPCITPLWITWGGAESGEFARQSQIYHGAWLAQGNRALLQEQPHANHFTAIHGFEDPNSSICQWLGNAMKATTS